MYTIKVHTTNSGFDHCEQSIDVYHTLKDTQVLIAVDKMNLRTVQKENLDRALNL